MRSLKSAAAAALLMGLAACTGDSTSPLAPEGQPLTTISDAAHAGAVPGFYFLPPMVSNPAYSGTFDGGLQPRVEICELAAGACVTTIAQYTTTSGTGGQAVQVGTSSYQVNWHTNQFNLDPAKHYRISVYVGTFQLGFADVDVVSSGKELKKVDTQEYIPLQDDRTLPIKFRIETGIAGQVIVTPDSASIPVGGTQQFTATVLDLHGNPIPGATPTWSSSAPAVATVDASGLATGVSPGQATITATYQAASGSATLTVFNPNTPPVAQPDTFQAIGNVTVPVAAPGVLANDTDSEDNVLQAVAGTYPTAAGGTATMNADGSFTYLSAAGFTGTDSFTYSVTDGQATSSSTVTVVSAYRVWYVDNAAAPGDGRDASPFNTLAGAEAASTAGETIFVRTGAGPYDGGITLKTGQSLTGQGVPSNVTATLNGQTVVLLAAGSAPTVTRTTGGATIQLATNNVVQGMDVTSSAGAGIAGSGFGTLTVGSLSVSATGGPALDLSAGDVFGAFDALSSAGSAGAGIRLVGVGGSFSAAGGSVTGSAGPGVEVTGGAGTFTYGGNVAVAGPLAVSVTGRTGGALDFGGTIASSGNGISVQNNSGGTIAFTGSSKSLSTGANPGVILANNAGAVISFGGGGLAIATTTGTGFEATGGGTIGVTGLGNTVTSAGGVAVHVQNTTIGAAGLTFRSVSANGGTNGIVLANTGSGGFQVTGDGASDPTNATRGRTTDRNGGGTIALGSGGTISGTSGAGISLSNATNVVLRNLVIQGNDGDGIAAASVAGLVVDNALVTGHAGSHGIHGTGVSGLSIIHSDLGQNATLAGAVEAADIWNLRFDNLSGTASVEHSLIHHSQETVFGVVNGSGSLSLTIFNTNITDTGTGAGGANGLQLTATGGSSMTVSLQNDSIARTRVRGVTASTALASSASINLTVNGSEFADNATVGLEVVHGSGGTALFSFTGNDFQRHGSVPVNINRLGSPGFTAFGDLTGTISGNNVGTAGVAGSGTTVSGNGIQVQSNGTGGATRVAIVNNTVRRVGQHGIFVSAVDASSPGTLLEARVEGNSVLDLSPGALDGINVVPGALSTDVPTLCLDVKNNVSTGLRNGLRARASGLPAAAPTIRLEGWDGVTPVNTYFTAQNTLAGASGPVSTTAGSGTFTAVANCNTP
ncbi:MAG TPA: Ig-like domain-containing protein [Longimicrobium sp.]|uniref:beta strand repeat-containing protein n=1 Tax=Longimicrobium sp. TaxID=2029185 RepID=UPI002EDA15DB